MPIQRRKMPGGVNHSTACRILEEEPFTVLMSKLQKGFLIPFLSLLFLMLLTLFQYSFPRLSLNIRGALMPPAAGCWLLAHQKIHTLLCLLVAGFSHSQCFLPPHGLCWFFLQSQYTFSLVFSKCLALFPHHFFLCRLCLIPYICVSPSFHLSPSLNFSFWWCSFWLNLYQTLSPHLTSLPFCLALCNRHSFCHTPSSILWQDVYFHRETHGILPPWA